MTGESVANHVVVAHRRGNAIILLLPITASPVWVTTVSRVIHRHARRHRQCLRHPRTVRGRGATGVNVTLSVGSLENKRRFTR